MMHQIFYYFTSAAIIGICLFIGNTIQSILHISIPGSILGMLLLFLLLATNCIAPKFVAPTAKLFVRFMVILFIPISVGLMEHFDVFSNNIALILLSTIGATTIVLIFLSLGLDYLLRRKK